MSMRLGPLKNNDIKMKKLFSTLKLMVLVMFAQSQITVTVSPTTFCTGAQVTVHTTVGPDASFLGGGTSQRFNLMVQQPAPYVIIDSSYLNTSFDTVITYTGTSIDATKEVYWLGNNYTPVQGDPYSYSISDTAYASTNVFVPSIPSFSIGPDTTICPNQPVTLYSDLTLPGITYAWNNGASSASPTVTTAGSFTLYVVYTDQSSNCSATASSNNSASVSVMLPTVKDVCMVSIDTTFEHNIVVWEKTTADSLTTEFLVYRDNVQIASVDRDSFSTYVDTAAGGNPNVTYHQYAIATVNQCGDTSAIGVGHTSIFLAFAQLGYITWTPYDVANTTYDVYKDQDGNGNWTLFHSGTQTQLNDPTYGPNTRYRVATVVTSCNPSRSIATVFSNTIDRSITSSIPVPDSHAKFTFGPNPATSQILFSTDVSVRLMSNIGEQMYAGYTNRIDVSDYSKGVYFLIINNHSEKIVVQ